MRTLKQALAELDAKCPPVVRCVEMKFNPVAMVTFCLWQAKEWTVPWSRLDAVSIFDEQELERMELFFPHHQVIVVGENLREIMDDIRSCKVSCLRDLPASHRTNLNPKAVFITKLEVRVLTDPAKHA